MAKKENDMAKAKDSDKVKARVLMDCMFGKVDDVVEVAASEAKDHANKLDSHPDAVAYAEGLKAAKA